MNKKTALYSITILFMVLFFYSGIVKLFDFQSFSSQLFQSPILKPIARWMAWLVPGIELMIVFQLGVTKWRLWGLYASFALMASFTIYMVLLTYSMDYVSCDCGGILEKIPPGLHIILNIFLAILAISGIYLEKLALKKRQ